MFYRKKWEGEVGKRSRHRRIAMLTLIVKEAGLPLARSRCSGYMHLHASCSPSACTSRVSPCLMFPRKLIGQMRTGHRYVLDDLLSGSPASEA